MSRAVVSDGEFIDRVKGKRKVVSGDLERLADMMLKGSLTQPIASSILEGKKFSGRSGGRANAGEFRVVEEDNEVFIPARDGSRRGDLLYSTGSDSFGDYVFVHEVFVQSDERGRGLGSALMDYVEKKARKARFSGVVLQVDRHNTKAIDFFENRGFTEVSSVNEGTVDRLTLRKNL